MSTIINKIDALSSLISPRKDYDKPIYNWYPFKHGYSKELVDTIISEFRLRKSAWVMDPFCGGGTTLLACKQAGINSHGFDILPFSVFLSNIKTSDYSIRKLKNAKQKIELNGKQTDPNITLPSIAIIKKAFKRSVKNELFQIKQRIEEIKDDKIRDFFNLGFLSILERVSNTSKTGGFLRIVNRNVKVDEIKTHFLNKINRMIKDVNSLRNSIHTKDVIAEAFIGDARKIPTNKSYSAIITSPPYPNRHDYTRIYTLEMIFDFVKDNKELKKIRYDTLRSHVEAKRKYDVDGYIQPLILKKLLKKVEKNGVNNVQIIEMICGYFEDMFLVLSEMKKCLYKKGKIALVISNVRYAGVNIPVDEILGEIGEQTGLKTKAIWIARYRGNSAQQMKKYKRTPSRESIIIWEK